MAAPVLIAVVVAGFAGLTVSRLGLNETGDNSTAGTSLNSAGDGAERAPALGSGPPRVMVEPSPEHLLATGTDYNPSSLPDTVSELARQSTPTAQAAAPDRADGTPGIFSGGSPTPGDPTPRKTLRSEAPPTTNRLQSVFGLERLADRAVLDACLEAVAVAHGQGPVAVELVDYASFRGQAALVVVFTDPSGARWAWVTGPDCGTAAHGADVAYQTRVG